MEKKQTNLKIVIALLVVIILLLIGFVIFFAKEFMDEKEELRELYYNKDSMYYDYTTNNDDVYKDENSNSENDVNITNNSKYISREKALSIALNNAKISKNDIRNIDIELDYKYNLTVYEVTFDYIQYEYEYYINAETGNIVKSFREID